MQIIKGNIDFIRANPERFFRTSGPTDGELIESLVGDAIILGCEKVQVFKEGGWWFICADKDWMSDGDHSIEELFSKIIPFPEAGPNSLRSEVLLGAFSQGLVTGGGGRLDPDYSTLEPEDLPTKLPREWQRYICFRP